MSIVLRRHKYTYAFMYFPSLARVIEIAIIGLQRLYHITKIKSAENLVTESPNDRLAR